MQVLITLYQIIEMITSIVLVMLIIIQFIIGLLFAFNVVRQRNEFLDEPSTMSINRLLDPVLRPIRQSDAEYWRDRLLAAGPDYRVARSS